MNASLIKLRQYLLSGVSYTIPFIACGGILIATAIAINSRYVPETPGKFDIKDANGQFVSPEYWKFWTA